MVMQNNPLLTTPPDLTSLRSNYPELQALLDVIEAAKVFVDMWHDEPLFIDYSDLNAVIHAIETDERTSHTIAFHVTRINRQRVFLHSFQEGLQLIIDQVQAERLTQETHTTQDQWWEKRKAQSMLAAFSQLQLMHKVKYVSSNLDNTLNELNEIKSIILSRSHNMNKVKGSF